jgi:pimeloyl-ACP methyl ester carboxylesterase
MKSGYAEVNGTRLYYELAGEGDPIVLINGFTLDTRMWDDQFLEFSKQYKVLRYDVRGHGKSAKPSDEEYTDPDDLISLMKYLDISHAHIIGLSMGGSIAIDFTLSYPEAVDSLVVVDSTLSGYTWTERYGESLRSIWTTCKEQGLEAAKAQWLDFEIFCTESENPRAYQGLKEIIDDYSGIHFLYGVPGYRVKVKDPPIANRLADIHVPTLVIVGERDSPDFHIIADLIVGDAPRARKFVIPRVKHMANMEDPVTFNKEVLSFLSSL